MSLLCAGQKGFFPLFSLLLLRSITHKEKLRQGHVAIRIRRDNAKTAGSLFGQRKLRESIHICLLYMPIEMPYKLNGGWGAFIPHGDLVPHSPPPPSGGLLRPATTTLVENSVVSTSSPPPTLFGNCAIVLRTPLRPHTSYNSDGSCASAS